MTRLGRQFGVDYPFAPAHRRQKLRERGGVAEVRARAEESQPASGVGRGEPLQKQPTEQSRMRAAGQKEAGPATSRAPDTCQGTCARRTFAKICLASIIQPRMSNFEQPTQRRLSDIP